MFIRDEAWWWGLGGSKKGNFSVTWLLNGPYSEPCQTSNMVKKIIDVVLVARRSSVVSINLERISHLFQVLLLLNLSIMLNLNLFAAQKSWRKALSLNWRLEGLNRVNCSLNGKGDKMFSNGPTNIYLCKVNNRNSRTKCEICSKLTIKTPKQRQWRHSSVFIVNYEHISHLSPMFLLMTLRK